MNKMFKMGALVIAVVLVIVIGIAEVALNTDAFIDVGDINEMQGNDVSLFSRKRVVRETGNEIPNLFAHIEEEVVEETEAPSTDASVGDTVYEGDTVPTTSTGEQPITGDVIDLTTLVGSTQDTVSASSAWGEIDINKQITVSGFRWDYMCWYKIKSESSNQYRLRIKYYPSWGNTKDSKGGGVPENEVPEAFDANGFAKIEDRYVVATTNIDEGGIGKVGQKLDVYLGDGTCIPCVVGDIKAKNSGEFWCTYGHFIGSSTQINVIEFVVSKQFISSMNSPVKCIPNLSQGITKIVRGDTVDY